MSDKKPTLSLSCEALTKSIVTGPRASLTFKHGDAAKDRLVPIARKLRFRAFQKNSERVLLFSYFGKCNYASSEGTY